MQQFMINFQMNASVSCPRSLGEDKTIDECDM